MTPHNYRGDLPLVDGLEDLLKRDAQEIRYFLVGEPLIAAGHAPIILHLACLFTTLSVSTVPHCGNWYTSGAPAARHPCPSCASEMQVNNTLPPYGSARG